MLVTVVGNGFPPPQTLFLETLKKSHYVIAADGGASHLLAVGKTPDLVIGDLDSLDSALLRKLQESSMIYKFPEDKDFTDLKLAYFEAERLSPQEIKIFSWADERLDYSLAAVLDFSEAKSKVEFISHRSSVYIVNEARPDFVFENAKGTKISIFPISSSTYLKTEGLQWNLNWQGVELPSFSQSNRVIAERASIVLGRGAAFIVVEKSYD